MLNGKYRPHEKGRMMTSQTTSPSTLDAADSTTEISTSELTPQHSLRSLLAAYGHILLAIVGASLFVFARPPVADLQAADARAAAAARGVGPSYWLNWFAGSAPGGYSVLTPTISAWLGVAFAAALSVVVIAVLARPLLEGARRQRTGAYLLVVCALCNLWSGRIAFSLGVAGSIGALVAFRRGRPWLGGGINAAAALLSPLAPAFVLIGLTGPFLTRPTWRGAILRFSGVSLIGLALPTVLFGAPGDMPYAFTTLCWTVGILLAASLLRLPRDIRISLLVGAAAAILLFLIPNGVGANMGRYAFLVMPPVVWALTEAPKRIIALALVPAMVYSGFQVIGDLHRASAPEAKSAFYTALRGELAGLPGLQDHRVEVIDTSTHRADVELVPTVYLARGWENQSDAEANPIFYTGAPLTAQLYRRWIDSAAVAWIAVPSRPLARNDEEAKLVTGGLGYVKEIWHDSNWRLYAVDDPQPIVSAPSRVVNATETTMRIEVPKAGQLTMRIRQSKYLTLTRVDDPSDSVCLLPAGDTAVTATITTPGLYLLQAKFDVAKLLDGQDCPTHS
ncbi:hypothetical protein SAMN05892883_0751 [Jatrophihabitans sp. GAS493]|nr:hypothetical protein SAMN05892883_0751 [Jatrophihabitans sp. GAS493]